MQKKLNLSVFLYLIILAIPILLFTGCKDSNIEESVRDRNFVEGSVVVGGASLLEPSEEAIEWENKLLVFADKNKEKIKMLNTLDYYSNDEIIITDFEMQLRNMLSFDEKSSEEIMDEIIVRNIIIRKAIEKELLDYEEINNIVNQTLEFKNEKHRETYLEIDTYTTIEFLSRLKLDLFFKNTQGSLEEYIIQAKSAISIKLEK